MPMPVENLATFLRLHPDAVISKIDHPSESIFFSENGRQQVMIFLGTEVVGVWFHEHTRADWSEIAQDQQEAVGF